MGTFYELAAGAFGDVCICRSCMEKIKKMKEKTVKPGCYCYICDNVIAKKSKQYVP